jgi:hypothetical protein
MSALKITAVIAKMQDCQTTSQKVSRLNRNSKLPEADEALHPLVQRRQVDRVTRRVGDQPTMISRISGKRHQEGDRSTCAASLVQVTAALARSSGRGLRAMTASTID